MGGVRPPRYRTGHRGVLEVLVLQPRKLTPMTKTQPSAKIISDVISPSGDRLTHMTVVFHRFVLAEFNTHRMFSRSSASSRAIPVERKLEEVTLHPAMPVEWPGEQPGMQGGKFLEGARLNEAVELFAYVHDMTTRVVNDYLESHPNKSDRLHKSLINRLLEPFAWHEVIVASTEWDNFFRQRVSALAQPEIRVPAEMMLAEFDASTPVEIGQNDWVTPYIRPEDDDTDIDRRVLSVARCARVSYQNHEGVRSPEDDMKLFKRLYDADPRHAAPFEMVATPAGASVVEGNFQGFHQLRHHSDISVLRKELSDD